MAVNFNFFYEPIHNSMNQTEKIDSVIKKKSDSDN